MPGLVAARPAACRTTESGPSDPLCRLIVAKVDIDDHTAAASRLGVQGIPTLVLFRGGHEVDRVVGALPKGPLRARLEEALSRAA